LLICFLHSEHSQIIVLYSTTNWYNKISAFQFCIETYQGRFNIFSMVIIELLRVATNILGTTH